MPGLGPALLALGEDILMGAWYIKQEMIPQLKIDGHNDIATTLEEAYSRKLTWRERLNFHPREGVLLRAVESLGENDRKVVKTYLESMMREEHGKGFMRHDSSSKYHSLLTCHGYLFESD